MRIGLLHFFVLTWEELRELAFRRRSFLSLLLYFGILALCVWGLADLQARMGPAGALLQDPTALDHLRGQLAERGWEDSFHVLLEVAQYPASIWIFQAFCILWFPTLVALVSCDMIAVDIQRGTLRFVLQRSGRIVFYLSKLVAHFLLFVILQLGSVAALIGFASWGAKGFALTDFIEIAWRYFAVFMPFLFFLVTSTAWISSASRRPLNALLKIHLLWLLFIALLFVWPWLSPLESGYTIGLILPFGQYLWPTVMSMSVWGGIFALLGLIGFIWRDV